MKKIFLQTVGLFVLAFLTSLLFGCRSSQPKLPAPEWNFQPNGIQINYTSDQKLNSYNNEPHSLVLSVYQMTEPSAFKSYAKTRDGLQRLLQISNLDKRKTIMFAELLDMQTFIIEPGTSETLFINRVKDSKWVGIVAGYFNLMPQHANYVCQFPIVHKEEGFFKKKTTTTVGLLNINLALGPNMIHVTGDNQ